MDPQHSLPEGSNVEDGIRPHDEIPSSSVAPKHKTINGEPATEKLEKESNTVPFLSRDLHNVPLKLKIYSDSEWDAKRPIIENMYSMKGDDYEEIKEKLNELGFPVTYHCTTDSQNVGLGPRKNGKARAMRVIMQRRQILRESEGKKSASSNTRDAAAAETSASGSPTLGCHDDIFSIFKEIPLSTTNDSASQSQICISQNSIASSTPTTHAGNWKPRDLKSNVSAWSAVSDEANSEGLIETSSSCSPLEQDSIPYISEDETEYSTDEIGDSLYNLDPPNAAPITEPSSVLGSILSPSKQSLVDRVMQNFLETFQNEIESFRPSDGSGQNSEQQTLAQNSDSKDYTATYTSTSSSGQDSTVYSEPSTSADKKGKQKRKNHKDDGDNGSNDDDRDPKRRRKLLSPPISPDDRNKFACPYRKNNPLKYSSSNKQWRSCALTPLENIARVKGHLYRHHMVYPCQRCKEIFKSQEEVSLHLKKVEACELRDIEISDGITIEIVERLKSRKKEHQDETREYKWRKVYELLFPGSTVPSPYYVQPHESTELEEYEEYCRRELPRIVRAEIQDLVNRETQPMEDRLISQLEGIVSNAQQRVYASYRATCASTTTNQSICKTISKPASEGSASMQSDTRLNFPNEQLRFSMPLNPPSGYGIIQSIPPSVPQASAELEECRDQAVTSEISHSGEIVSERRPFQDPNSATALSSYEEPDWSVVTGLEDTRNSTFDPDDFGWIDLEEEEPNDFGLENFLSLNPSKATKTMPSA